MSEFGNATGEARRGAVNGGNLLPLYAVAAVVSIACSLYAFDFPRALISSALSCSMLAIAFSDGRDFIVPDFLSLPSIPAGLFATGYLAQQGEAPWAMMDHFAATVFATTALLIVKEAYAALRGRQGLGLGDVKLAAVAGAWIGMEGFANALLLAAGIALVTVIAIHLIQGRSYQATTAVPFGAFFAPTIWLVWFVGAATA